MDLSDLNPGRRHAELREALHIFQSQAATFLNCTVQTICAIENDRAEFRLSDLDRYHDVGVNRPYLTRDSDRMFRDGFTADNVRENILSAIRTENVPS